MKRAADRPMKAPAILAAALLAALALAGGAGPRATTRPASGLERAGELVVRQMARSDFAAATRTFDAKMKRALGPDKLGGAWDALVASSGGFIDVIATRTEDLDRYTRVYVTCRFVRKNVDVQLVYNDRAQVAGLWYLPAKAVVTAKPPEGIAETPAVVGGGRFPLPATLSLPAEADGVPGVVLVHGSGPRDRDGTVGANKPFRDLAWGLARRGVAVVRYEKRTRIHGKELAARAGGFTVREETVDDAVAAAALLRATPGVDPARVFVLGHSFGGMLVGRIARRDRHAAGFILLAAANRRVEDALLEQTTYVYGLDGRIDEIEQVELRRIRAAARRIKDPALSPRTRGLLLGAPAAYWLDLRGLDPPAEARDVGRPMLILQGGRDYQVTRKEFGAWKAALAQTPNVRFKLYPKLNHLFIEGAGKPSPAEYRLGGHVHEQVLDDIAAWIAAPRPARAPTSAPTTRGRPLRE